MNENIDYVNQGYKEAAEPYRDQKNNSQAEMPIFINWLNNFNYNSEILEIGCGSGYPIAKTIIERGLRYTGIDLSKDQIKLANNEFPLWSNNFTQAEMLSFCIDQSDEIYDGIISMFSIRHLPRINHVELFTNIYRIIKANGLFLVDLPKYSHQGKGTWFNGLPMYWSSFSPDWIQMTLKEIGFKLIDTYENIKIFNGKEESTIFQIYEK